MDYALMESLTFLLSGQYNPKDGTWTMTFIAPNPQLKMHSYAVAVKNNDPMRSPSKEEILSALSPQATNVMEL